MRHSTISIGFFLLSILSTVAAMFSPIRLNPYRRASSYSFFKGQTAEEGTSHINPIIKEKPKVKNSVPKHPKNKTKSRPHVEIVQLVECRHSKSSKKKGKGEAPIKYIK
ncbi:hypothetical protein PTTG_12408 [Puccinia triticina 1-1 BBBD Race 1]|uniref:Uncharacterized protein n=2 Tax=Puccinia triticina TaxID=208348 RepID=A0A180GP08_PUCT1|nr:uncharacterized protein PtA15_2A8 [Puccinia triticina]OAV94042.1 hypothetical protein PTTG_12408 [Puccinia triticina 1-1 BBBD Race 1]WAQ81697.1 hypothetical protein PtA15_2A8 [Puccinia triticina]WAR52583.1 hypothetical protein PtB15_2B7 [Puccinia triticina]